MSSSWFEKVLLEKQNVVFPPNISFRGEIRNLGGGELSERQLNGLKWLIEPVTSATEEIILPRQSGQFKGGVSKVSPRTIIDFSGWTDAYTWIPDEARGNSSDHSMIVVPLGIPFACYSLPVTVSIIERIVSTPELDLSDLQGFQPPADVFRELDNLMDAWDSSLRSGWRIAAIPAGLAAIDSSTARFMVRILLGHELSHWFKTIYKDAEWARRMKDVTGYYKRWVKEEKFLVHPKMMASLQQLLSNQVILSNWVEETHADCGAYEFAWASETKGGWASNDPSVAPALMQVNISMSMLFWLFALLEIHARSRGLELPVDTHPPYPYRSAVFCYIEAKKRHMSQQDFLFKQFGAGMAVSYVMERIIEGYVRVRNLPV